MIRVRFELFPKENYFSFGDKILKEISGREKVLQSCRNKIFPLAQLHRVFEIEIILGNFSLVKYP